MLLYHFSTKLFNGLILVQPGFLYKNKNTKKYKTQLPFIIKKYFPVYLIALYKNI